MFCFVLTAFFLFQSSFVSGRELSTYASGSPVTEVGVAKLVTRIRFLEDNFFLLKFAEKDIKIKTLSLHGLSTDVIESFVLKMDKRSIVNAIIKKIKEKPKWDQKITKKERLEIVKNRKKIKLLLKESIYVWAELLKKSGDVALAKKHLNALFDLEYIKLMDLKYVESKGRKTVLDNIHSFFHPLSSMSNKKEKDVLKEKISKVKVHTSNLDEIHVLI